MDELPFGYKYKDANNYVKTGEKVEAFDVEIGGVYVRPNGSQPVIVTEVFLGRIKLVYFDGNTDNITPSFMWATNKVNKTTEKETKMDKLYQVIGTETYAKHIATNSKGLYVLEVKGTGEVITKEKTEVEEVIPYTVSITFLNDGPTYSSKEYAYFSKEGDVSKGDIIIVNGSLAKVTAVATKSTKATKELEGQIVLTKKIGE